MCEHHQWRAVVVLYLTELACVCVCVCCRTGFGAKKKAGGKKAGGKQGGKPGKKAKKSNDMQAQIIQAAFKKYKVRCHRLDCGHVEVIVAILLLLETFTFVCFSRIFARGAGSPLSTFPEAGFRLVRALFNRGSKLPHCTVVAVCSGCQRRLCVTRCPIIYPLLLHLNMCLVCACTSFSLGA